MFFFFKSTRIETVEFLIRIYKCFDVILYMYLLIEKLQFDDIRRFYFEVPDSEQCKVGMIPYITKIMNQKFGVLLTILQRF